jgi:hypothetical protein
MTAFYLAHFYTQSRKRGLGKTKSAIRALRVVFKKN